VAAINRASDSGTLRLGGQSRESRGSETKRGHGVRITNLILYGIALKCVLVVAVRRFQRHSPGELIQACECEPGNCVCDSRPPDCTTDSAVDNVYRGYNTYFADLHTHSVFSIDCIQRERMEQTPADILADARDVACIDSWRSSPITNCGTTRLSGSRGGRIGVGLRSKTEAACSYAPALPDIKSRTTVEGHGGCNELRSSRRK